MSDSFVFHDDFLLRNNDSKTTLWMGDLDFWMDEAFLKQLWSSLLSDNVAIKLIRDKRTNLSLGYAFVGFESSQQAQDALNTFHGVRIPNSTKVFRLNWASGGGICDRKEDRAPEYSLFVGDLSNDIDETYLLALFRARYPSCHSAKIMTDPLTGLSRGYGFVRFLNQLEQQEAVLEMNGVLCDNRPIRVSFATPKNNHLHQKPSGVVQQPFSSPPYQYEQPLSPLSQHDARYIQLSLQAPALVNQPTDPGNTTVFVGGLSAPVTEEELQHYFAPFGEVVYVKIPLGKGCGFVQYVSRSSAEKAIEKMNGFLIGTSKIRLSWGRSQADKSSQSLPYNNLHQQQPKSPTMTTPTENSNSRLRLLNSSFRPLSPPILSQAQSSNSLLSLNQQQQVLKQQQDQMFFRSPTNNDDWLLRLNQTSPRSQQFHSYSDHMVDNLNRGIW
ncbi:hypothetical protein BD560DRAFT_356043 [Blakeslea trispora]|nr:hypothetical protein BD560DRAFT_356043 [Blakeslea trispora]